MNTNFKELNLKELQRQATRIHRAKADIAWKIIATIADEFGVSPVEVVGAARPERLTVPRHVAMKFMHEDCELPLAETARLLNRKDHGSALCGIRDINNRMEVSETFRQKVEAIRLKIAPLSSGNATTSDLPPQNGHLNTKAA